MAQTVHLSEWILACQQVAQQREYRHILAQLIEANAHRPESLHFLNRILQEHGNSGPVSQSLQNNLSG